MTNGKVKILLADDHAVLRSGLRLLIDNQPDLEVVAEADNGSEAIAKAKALQPDLILLDLSMVGMDGLATLPILKDELPDTRVLILTMYDDASYLQEALHAGASGYILKKAVDNELLMAIRAVMRGETYIHSAMTNKLLQNVMPDTASTQKDVNPWTGLSEREFDV
ncbi:MAG TPA: response regulator transcription factor, partial [Aggregatilineales bacterium]|nr:response regulator transcription factor [Aggregatilineales bacterium]